MAKTFALLAWMVAFACSGDDVRPPNEGSQLTIEVVGEGRVTSKPDQIDCNGSCTGRFASGTTVVLTAVASSGGAFLGWSGACAGLVECTLTIERDLAITATFGSSEVELDVLVDGPGSVSSPDGFACADRCIADRPRGDELELSAQPNLGATFLGWSGACSGTGSCTVAADRSISVVALFAGASLHAEVEVIVSGPGAVESNAGGSCRDQCALEVAPGSVLELYARADEGARFGAWGDACEGQVGEMCTIEVDGDVTVRATFTTGEGSLLSVYKDGFGAGTIRAIDGNIDCGSICAATYPPNSVVELVATADRGSRFAGWIDCEVETAETCLVEPDLSPSVGAIFDLEGDPILDVTVIGPGRVTSAPAGIECPSGVCSAAFPPGMPVTLTPLPNDLSRFWRWEGDCTGNADCVLDMTTSRNVDALFGDACNERSINLGQAGAIVASSDPAMDVAALTIEAWVFNLPGLSGEILARHDLPSSQCNFVLTVGGGEVTFCVFSACAANGVDTICIDMPMTDVFPNWRHVAATFSPPDDIHLFVDGLPTNNGYWANGFFDGVLRPIIVDVSSTIPTHVASLRFAATSLYAQGFVPQPAPPPLPSDVFNWQIEEGSGTVSFDSTQNGIDGTITNGTWSTLGPGCP